MDDKTIIRFPNDNTVIRPRPGGKRKTLSGVEQSSKYSQSDKTKINIKKNSSLISKIINKRNYSQLSNDLENYNSLNSDNNNVYHTNDSNDLLCCSSTLLSLMIKLSNSVIHKDVAQLKYNLQDEIKQFEINAGRLALSNDKILQARYIICTSLDEIVASTPWGQESDWSQQSLLSLFHGETWGGEKIYLLLERLLKEPAKNLDILELVYVCISLGFQGKYRVIENGYAEVEKIRENLYRQIRYLKNDFNKELSNNWFGVSDRRSVLIRYVPLWVVGAFSGVILLAMFSSFTYILDQSSTPVIDKINKLGPTDLIQRAISNDSSKNSNTISESPIKVPQRNFELIKMGTLINKIYTLSVNQSQSHHKVILWRIL